MNKIGIAVVPKRGSALQEQLAQISALGFEAVDIGLQDIKDELYRDEQELVRHCAEIRAAAEQNGLTVSQVHGPWPTDDTTEEGRAIGWSCMHRAVRACALLGSGLLVLHPQMPFGWDCDTDPDVAEEITVALLKELVPDCEEYDVTVCLENMPFQNQRISTMDFIIRAVEKAGSSHVGVCLDTGHSNCMGHIPAEDIRLAGKRIKAVHLHDNTKKRDDHLPPFMGRIDWAETMTALREVGFTGALSLELHSPAPDLLGAELNDLHGRLAVASARRLRELFEK